MSCDEHYVQRLYRSGIYLDTHGEVDLDEDETDVVAMSDLVCCCNAAVHDSYLHCLCCCLDHSSHTISSDGKKSSAIGDSMEFILMINQLFIDLGE